MVPSVAPKSCRRIKPDACGEVICPPLKLYHYPNFGKRSDYAPLTAWRRFRIVVGAASDDFKLQRVGTNPWSLGSRVRSDYFSHPISHGRGSYVTFLNCRACLRLYPFGMRRSLNKFQELPDDCACDGEGLAPSAACRGLVVCPNWSPTSARCVGTSKQSKNIRTKVRAVIGAELSLPQRAGDAPARFADFVGAASDDFT